MHCGKQPDVQLCVQADAGTGSSLALSRYGLKYDVAVVEANEADSWYSEGGLLLFKFRAVDFPELVAFSGNNPDVL